MSLDYSHVAASKAFEPTEQYEVLRGQCPVHKVTDFDPAFYVVSRFDDVVATLKQPDLWVNGSGPGVFYQESGVLGTTDDPDHQRHRHVLRDAFLPTSIARLEPRIAELADHYLDAMLPLGEGDFVPLYAAPLPAVAIAELFGIPEEEREGFRQSADDIATALSTGNMALYEPAKQQLGDAIDRAMAVRDRLLDAAGAPAEASVIGEVLPDDVISRLAVARRNGTIDGGEARHLGHQVLVAGHETTTSLLGMMLYRLIQRPELMQRLRDDPTLIPIAIEEALRFDSPAQGLFRTNAQECVVHGETIPEGSKLQLLFASANRDPRKFDHPDDFDIDRPQKQIMGHVAFGWGIHHCIGAPLARLETKVSFEKILRRMGDIELAGNPVRNDSFILHGLTSLPLRWTTLA